MISLFWSLTGRSRLHSSPHLGCTSDWLAGISLCKFTGKHVCWSSDWGLKLLVALKLPRIYHWMGSVCLENTPIMTQSPGSWLLTQKVSIYNIPSTNVTVSVGEFETEGVVFRQRRKTPYRNTTNIVTRIKHINTRMRKKEGEGVWLMRLAVLATRVSGFIARNCSMKSIGESSSCLSWEQFIVSESKFCFR